MKCPIDQTEMEKGSLANQGSGWFKLGVQSTLNHFTSVVLGGKKIYAYKCSKCGKVELTTESDKKEGEMSS